MNHRPLKCMGTGVSQISRQVLSLNKRIGINIMIVDNLVYEAQFQAVTSAGQTRNVARLEQCIIISIPIFNAHLSTNFGSPLLHIQDVDECISVELFAW